MTFSSSSLLNLGGMPLSFSEPRQLGPSLFLPNGEYPVIFIAAIRIIASPVEGPSALFPFHGRPGGELTGLEKATQELRAALDNKEATPKEIKATLDALRKEKKEATRELRKAQRALKETVTIRQEGRLVTIGLID